MMKNENAEVLVAEINNNLVGSEHAKLNREIAIITLVLMPV